MGQQNRGSQGAQKKNNARRLERLEIIAPLLKRGNSYRKIQAEVMSALNLPSYSLGTVKHDIEFLLKEWREERIENVDLNIQLELQRIDELVQEAWSSWEKSKEDYQKQKGKQVAVPRVEGEGEDGGEGGIEVIKMEQTKEDMRSCGDPRYLDTINKLLIERRKILGLYAPEKNINTELSFVDFLVATGRKKAQDTSAEGI